MKEIVNTPLDELREYLLALYGPLVLAPKNRKMIAAEYNVHVSTLRQKIKKYCPEINGSDTLMPVDLLLIYSRLGVPPQLK
ncbi:MAG: hypothetical protein ACOYPR_17305 [Saprospiraceae bacterium]|jgi:hypothetical protein